MRVISDFKQNLFHHNFPFFKVSIKWKLLYNHFSLWSSWKILLYGHEKWFEDEEYPEKHFAEHFETKLYSKSKM